MPPAHFWVTQVRNAASCPRILYFDHVYTRRNRLRFPRVTRIWKTGEDSEATACGTLFHHTVEHFHRHAGQGPALRQLLERRPAAEELAGALVNHVYWHHLGRDQLFQKDGQQQANFMRALRTYLSELAHLLAFSLGQGQAVEALLEDFFGGRRQRVEATFAVGPQGEPVRVTGVLDYVFRDSRTGRLRILDYKLTPADQPANDLFQVCLYALMHNALHGTEGDAGVLYLHPERQLLERPWAEVHADRGKVFDLLASMREWIDFDETTGKGLKPPGEPACCNGCPWRDECEQRLGPKDQGQRLDHWTAGARADPAMKVCEPALPAPEPSALTDDIPLSPTLPGDDHLLIGSTGDEPVSLPRNVLPTHLAVVGAAGSGKTWLAKVLAEEAILLGIPVLAIDPQGDLVQFLQTRDPGEVPETLRDRHASFGRLVEPRVWTPGSSHGLRLCLSPLRIVGDADLASIADPARREEERQDMLASLASNLVGLARAGGEEDSQQTFVLQLLRRLADPAPGKGGTAPSELDLGVLIDAIKEPDSYGIDADAFIKKAEREKLARKLNSLRHGPTANLFTGGTPLDLDHFCRPGAAGKVSLNVVYLNALTDDAQKQFFVAALAEEVYRWMIATGGGEAGSQGRLLVYLDEARDYVPAGTAKPPAKMPLIRLFTQGRKYGVGCLMCTQSPRSVDYNVFGNCSTKVIGRLESAQDAERVSEWFAVSGPAPPWVSQRAGAAPGTFVGRWPGMPPELEGVTIRSRMLFSLHEGAWPPDRVEEAMRRHARRSSGS